MAVLAPMPRARVSTAVAVNPLLCRSCRKAKRRSFIAISRIRADRSNVTQLGRKIESWHRTCRVEGCVRSFTVFLLASALVAAPVADDVPRAYTEVPEIAHGQTVIWHDP